MVRRDADLGEVDHHHGGPGHGDALGDGAADGDQPAGPVGEDVSEGGAEVQAVLVTAVAGRGGREGGEVEEDQDEQDRGGDGVGEHVGLYVGQ